jgi:hypothetical protein
VFNYHLAVGVRDARKKVPYGSVGLFVNVLLPLGDGLGQAKSSPAGIKLAIPECRPCLFHNSLPDMVSDSV